MRAFLAALPLCLCLAVPQAEAKPTRDLSGEIVGDRWRMAQGASATDVTRSMRCPPPHCSRKVKHKWKKRYRPPGYPVIGAKKRKTLVAGFIREVRRALPRRGGRGDLTTFHTIVG